MAERPRRGRPTKRTRRRGTGVARRRRRRFQRIDVDTAPKGPQLLIIILGLIAIGAITLNFFGPSPEDEEALVSDFIQPDRGPGFTSVDPEPFRGEIVEFEEALFETPGATEGRFDFAGRDIASAANPLVNRLRNTEGGRAEAAARDLDTLATDAGASGFDLDRLRKLRERWLIIRRSTFDSAPWMTTASASVLVGGSDQATHAVYQDIANDLLSLVESALYDAESLTEGAELMDASELADARRDWRDSVLSWREDLDNIRDRMPDRPSSSAGPELLTAVQSLESALASANGLFKSSSAPKSPLNRRPYLRTLESIERARDALSRL